MIVAGQLRKNNMRLFIAFLSLRELSINKFVYYNFQSLALKIAILELEKQSPGSIFLLVIESPRLFDI